MNYAFTEPDIVAQYFLYKIPMSQKKLHKMLFFAYSWYLYLENDSVEKLENCLFPNSFQAWVHGPVLRSLYPTYKDYGWNAISLISFDESLVKSHSDFLNTIIETYGCLTADELEKISHSNIAWINAREGYSKFDACKEQIDDAIIYKSLTQ